MKKVCIFLAPKMKMIVDILSSVLSIVLCIYTSFNGLVCTAALGALSPSHGSAV